jgi:uncharacterized protein YoxC
MEATINKLRKVAYVAVEFNTGVSDFVVAVRKPDGSTLSPAPTVTEQGDGIYTFEYTPDVVGLWQEKVSSVVNGDRAVRTVKVTAADVDDVKSQTASIESKVDTVDGKVDAVQTSVNTVEGKVDTVDANVDAVKAKTDNLPTNTAQSLQDIQDSVDGIDAEIKPGGYFA